MNYEAGQKRGSSEPRAMRDNIYCSDGITNLCAMKIRRELIGLGHELKFTCEEFDDDMTWLDTKVYFKDRFLFWIAGSDIDAFIKAFRELHSEFAI